MINLKHMAALLVLLCTGLAGTVHSSPHTPEGRWITIDDNTGIQKSIVELVSVDGKLTGTIVELLDKDETRPPICDLCPGELHNKPLIGLRFLWSMRPQGDSWSGGEILDPETGNTYRCKMTLSEDGRQLKVRGYLGISLFGRTQEWNRVPEQLANKLTD